MKSIFLAGSRKFFDELETIKKNLKKENIRVETAGKWDKNTPDTLESEKNALLRAFKMIDESDILYVIAKDGYVGKTVCMEIAYAYAKNKEIISSNEINEYSAKALITKIKTPKELIEYCK